MQYSVKGQAVEEVVCLLPNQMLRYIVQRACGVKQIVHVLYVVSGGGHRHLRRTEVSFDRPCVHDTEIT